MPSEKSARVQVRKRMRNEPLRSRAKTYIRKARRAIAASNADSAQEAVRDAFEALDKAAQKGAIHRNNASRRKSRIMKQFNKAMQSTSRQ